ncbi:hypothetical protein HN709_00590 [Candidatus Peregrinibacteria bacterium]|jgi:hypothetical protein|nr:hypothetical protein [Candidatus Peregrinibacteria bacterium]MBT7736166.1 hypothetical protein [Candidatus Peregrinibacteria bacterium]
MLSDGTIDLRKKDESDDEPEFKIGKKSEDRVIDHKILGRLNPITPEEAANEVARPHNKVKVKFDKFVSLVATHAYEEIFEEHADEEIIISTDLLTDLANSHEEGNDKKGPLTFMFGILLGVAVMWILYKYVLS